MKNWPYLRKRLTDGCEIWHSDARWPSELYWHLKFQTLQIQDGGAKYGTVIHIYFKEHIGS